MIPVKNSLDDRIGSLPIAVQPGNQVLKVLIPDDARTYRFQDRRIDFSSDGFGYPIPERCAERGTGYVAAFCWVDRRGNQQVIYSQLMPENPRVVSNHHRYPPYMGQAQMPYRVPPAVIRGQTNGEA